MTVALSYALAAYTRFDRSTVFDEGTKTCKSTLGALLSGHRTSGALAHSSPARRIVPSARLDFEFIAASVFAQ